MVMIFIWVKRFGNEFDVEENKETVNIRDLLVFCPRSVQQIGPRLFRLLKFNIRKAKKEE